jgi:hypothetical protein
MVEELLLHGHGAHPLELVAAAGIFQRLGLHDRAGSCFEAAQLFLQAAHCFETAQLFLQAANCFMQAGQPDTALRACQKVR